MRFSPTDARTFQTRVRSPVAPEKAGENAENERKSR
jgi:hypothetical protein